MENLPVRVLLVDDDEDDYVITRDLLAEIEGQTFDVDWAASYEAALEAWGRHAHDVYLVDYRLGERSGLELLSEVQGNGRQSPMILLTGQGDHEVDLEAMKAGAADFLVKGRLDASSLERSIRYAIERSRTLEALRASEAANRALLAETQASLQEKMVLLQEIHHRVKNNLQIISSILNLQAQQIQDQQILKVLQESQTRIRSMALIHEKLYQSHNLSRIDLAEYIRELATFLFNSYRTLRAAREISLNIQAEPVLLGIDQAVPCGLILNELIANALKHAFPPDRLRLREGPPDWAGQVRIDLRTSSDGRLTLVVADNGVGLPPEFDMLNTDSLGLHLVRILVQQLDGTLEVQGQGGTQFRITFIVP